MEEVLTFPYRKIAFMKSNRLKKIVTKNTFVVFGVIFESFKQKEQYRFFRSFQQFQQGLKIGVFNFFLSLAGFGFKF